MQEAIYVQVDDWDGLYIDGKLVGEGSSMNLINLLDGKTLSFIVRSHEADTNYVLNVGAFPPTFDELLDHQYMWEEDFPEDYQDQDYEEYEEDD